MLEADAIMSEEVLVLLDRAMRRLQPKPGDLVTLAYFSEFKERDGSPVVEFAPGYSPLIVEGPPPDYWSLMRLPNGAKVPFWPRQREHQVRWLIMTIASSAYATFSLTAAQ